MEELKKHVIRPFLAALKQEGEKTLAQMLSKSSEIARDAVEHGLANEEQRYENERRLDEHPSSSDETASALATLLNLIAAEAALLKVQEYLNGLPLP